MHRTHCLVSHPLFSTRFLWLPCCQGFHFEPHAIHPLNTARAPLFRSDSDRHHQSTLPLIPTCLLLPLQNLIPQTRQTQLDCGHESALPAGPDMPTSSHSSGTMRPKPHPLISSTSRLGKPGGMTQISHALAAKMGVKEIVSASPFCAALPALRQPISQYDASLGITTTTKTKTRGGRTLLYPAQSQCTHHAS